MEEQRIFKVEQKTTTAELTTPMEDGTLGEAMEERMMEGHMEWIGEESMEERMATESSE